MLIKILTSKCACFVRRAMSIVFCQWRKRYSCLCWDWVSAICHLKTNIRETRNVSPLPIASYSGHSIKSSEPLY